MTKIIAVVSSFNPDPPTLRRTINSISAQVSKVVLVDDGSVPWVSAIDLGLDNVQNSAIDVIRLSENEGLAHALNKGMLCALSLGATHILTLDQDTELSPTFVSASLKAQGDAEALGLRVFATGGNLSGVVPAGSATFSSTMNIIQSGMIIQVKYIPLVGFHDERLFIDCVETDYCLRAISRGLDCVVSLRSLMKHQLGQSEVIASYRAPRGVPLHSPVRRYYITRNRLEIMRRWAFRFPYWTAHQSVDQLRVFIINISLSRQRVALLLAAVAGIADFLRFRQGRIPSRFERWLAR